MAGETVPAQDPEKKAGPQQCGGNPEAGVDIGAGASDRARVIEVNEKPAAGQVLALEASSQEIIRILFGIDGATVKEADGNLYVYFHDGGVIVIKGATISQLCSNIDAAPAPVDGPDSVPDPESAQLVDLTGSGFRQLIPGPIGEASLTPTGALTDAELDRVWFRLGYEKAGATPDFQGDPDSHGNPAEENHPPVAAGDFLAASEDGTVVIPVATLLANDRDSEGDTLVIVSVDGATNGTVQLSGENVTFTPALNYHGHASFIYTVSDGNGGSATANVDLTIGAVNDPPTGADATVATTEDTAFSLTVADFGFSDPNDSPGDSLVAVTITSLPTNGTLLLSGVAVSAGQSVAVADISAGALVFQPDTNANGVAYARFTFQVQDSGGTANGGQDTDPIPNTVTISVTAVNDPPVAGDDAFSTNEDMALSGSVLANDSDVEGPLAVSLAAGPANGSLSLNIDGTFTYTPAANFNGADGFSYIVTDGDWRHRRRDRGHRRDPGQRPAGRRQRHLGGVDRLDHRGGHERAPDQQFRPRGRSRHRDRGRQCQQGTVGLAGVTVTYTGGAADGELPVDGHVLRCASGTGIVSVTNVSVTERRRTRSTSLRSERVGL